MWFDFPRSFSVADTVVIPKHPGTNFLHQIDSWIILGTAMDDQSHHLSDRDADVPPIPGDWPRIYAAVLCYLFILIAALYAVSRVFTY